MIGFYIITLSRFPLRTPEKKICFDKNRAHDSRTGRCARLPTSNNTTRAKNILHCKVKVIVPFKARRVELRAPDRLSKLLGEGFMKGACESGLKNP